MLLAALLVGQEDLLLRGVQAFVFASIAWLVQPGLRLRRTVLFLAATVLFNLVTPAGRVLFRVTGAAITEGALLVGSGKAVTLGGLLFISRLMVDPRLRLPGTAGALLGTTMTYLSRLMDGRAGFRFRSPVQSLDRALEAVAASPVETGTARASGTTTTAGLVCAVVLIALCGGAVLWGQLRG